MITIPTFLGTVRCTQFTSKHSRRNGHRDPADNSRLLEALESNRFHVVDRLDSHWKGHPATNLVLVIETAFETFLVVLKTLKDHLLLVTAYPAHGRQLRKYFQG